MTHDSVLGSITVGDRLPAFITLPISRWTLAAFAGGSGDLNPIHIDIDFAHASGLEDVFAHGMLSMAYLGRLLTKSFSQSKLRSFRVRFAAITPVNARVTCTATVTEAFEAGGEKLLRLDLKAIIDDGTVTLIGEAVVASP